MVEATTATSWRESRRESARAAIVEAAWELVREEGLAGLSLRELARRAGITTPTIYAYFDSKNAIYDAMFGQAAEEFAANLAAPYDSDDPLQVFVSSVRRFADFCTADVARYQLLFQRTIPGFEPSPQSFAHAVAALDITRYHLAALGITDPRYLDMWTALGTGLVDQQISNDPGGHRWIRMIDDFVEMFVSFCQDKPRARRVKRAQHPTRTPANEGRRAQ